MATIFQMIIDNKIPSTKLYEDKLCLVILDINPVSIGHSLVISKEVYDTTGDTPDDILSHLICIAKKVELKLREVTKCDGSNILINNSPASGQEIPHIHIHVIPRFINDGQKLSFSKTKYEDGEMASLGEKLKI